MTDISASCQAEMSALPEFSPVWEYPPMPATKEILRERLQEALDNSAFSPHALSVAIGANHSYIAQILNGKGGMPAADRLARIADVLGTTVGHLTGGAPAAHSEVGVRDKPLEWNGPTPETPPIPIVGTGDCADLAVVETDSGRHVEVERSSFDPEYHVRYIATPPLLRGRRGIYAIYFHGSSMEPRFYPGEVGLVDSHRPPSPGEYALVQLNTGDSDDVVSVLAKKFIRRTATEIVLEQYNPPLTFSVPAARVQRIHRIMPQTELLFG